MRKLLILVSLLLGVATCKKPINTYHTDAQISHFNGVGIPNQYCSSFNLFSLDAIDSLSSLVVDTADLSCTDVFGLKGSVCRPTLSAKVTTDSPVPDAFIANLCTKGSSTDCETKLVGGSGAFSFLPKGGTLTASVKACVGEDRAPLTVKKTDTVEGKDYYCGAVMNSGDLEAPEFNDTDTNKNIASLIKNLEGLNTSIASRASKLYQELQKITQACRDDYENPSCQDNQMLALASLVNMGEATFIDTVQASYGQDLTTNASQSSLQLADDTAGKPVDYCAAIGTTEAVQSAASSTTPVTMIPIPRQTTTPVMTQPITQILTDSSSTATTATAVASKPKGTSSVAIFLYVAGGALIIASGAYLSYQAKVYYGQKPPPVPPPDEALARTNTVNKETIVMTTDTNAAEIAKLDQEISATEQKIQEVERYQANANGELSRANAFKQLQGTDGQHGLYGELHDLQLRQGQLYDKSLDAAHFAKRLKAVQYLKEAQLAQKGASYRVQKLQTDIDALRKQLLEQRFDLPPDDPVVKPAADPTLPKDPSELLRVERAEMAIYNRNLRRVNVTSALADAKNTVDAKGSKAGAPKITPMDELKAKIAWRKDDLERRIKEEEAAQKKAGTNPSTPEKVVATPEPTEKKFNFKQQLWLEAQDRLYKELARKEAELVRLRALPHDLYRQALEFNDDAGPFKLKQLSDKNALTEISTKNGIATGGDLELKEPLASEMDKSFAELHVQGDEFREQIRTETLHPPEAGLTESKAPTTQKGVGEAGEKFNMKGIAVAAGGILVGAALIMAGAFVQNSSQTQLAAKPADQVMDDASAEISKLFDQKSDLESKLVNTAMGTN